MKKIFLFGLSLLVLCASCQKDFLNITPTNSITDDAVWASSGSALLFVNDVYNSLSGPLYNFTAGDGLGNHMFDFAFTDDVVDNNNAWNQFEFTPSNVASLVTDRWTPCYTSIRKTNLGIEKITAATDIGQDDKNRLLGDLHFLRGMFYFELFRFYGGVPIITKALDRKTDTIFNARNTAEETLQFIISEFKAAADNLPVTAPTAELGRATKGAAIGMQAVTYLYGAGVVDSKYYANAAEMSNVLINGELANTYKLFPDFTSLFLEQNENSSEAIFDIQYAYPYKFSGFQTVAAPPQPGPGNDYGWGWSYLTEDLAEAFEMKDGSKFDPKNLNEANNPFQNRDERFYGTFLYNDEAWKGTTLYTSTNVWDSVNKKFVQNSPNGLYNTGSASETITGYYLRKHMNEAVADGYANRGLGVGGGCNVMVLRYAEILLTYAEAQNEVSGADQSVYKAINLVRERAHQPDLPNGLSQSEMRERIHNERRVELAIENKRWFDIQRLKEGNKYLNGPIHGMNVTYIKDNDGKITPTYTKFTVLNKVFTAPKDYLLPIPQNVMDRNPKLVQNPGW